MNVLRYALNKHPIIVSLTDARDLEKALRAETSVIILIQADISTLGDVVKRIKETDKLIFVHIDLMKGLKRDPAGIEFLANHIGIDGIVTTHANLIRTAQRLDLLAIQRIFILDSASVKQGIKSIQESRPDAVEVLPGVAVPHIKDQIESKIRQLVIAGGVINTEDEIMYILNNGAEGVSSSATELWTSAPDIKKRLKQSDS